jgi:hypothetical protein
VNTHGYAANCRNNRRTGLRSISQHDPHDISELVAALQALDSAEESPQEQRRNDLVDRLIAVPRKLVEPPPDDIVDVLNDFADALETMNEATPRADTWIDRDTKDAVAELRRREDRPQPPRRRTRCLNQPILCVTTPSVSGGAGSAGVAWTVCVTAPARAGRVASWPRWWPK